MSKLTKAAVTIQLLWSGRNGNPGRIYSVDEIVAKVNQVFPGGKGTSKDCVYFYASREKVGLSRSNKAVDRSAYDALQVELSLATPKAPEEEPAGEAEFIGPVQVIDAGPSFEDEVEAMRLQIRAEIEAEVRAAIAAEQPKVRVVRGGGRKK